MYLKEIKMNGFKSFVDRINIVFNNGITGIVGPNGSGKSNVVDAIRWVLGEQSVKSLRGDLSMTDVIFSGSKSRSASNIASVTLIFDNSNNYFPLDFKEVSIKRKVYKDGTNEYFINNEQCRLKDITNLMLDTGLSKESFNIISQGKIEEILSNRPSERRIVFEEAAGVLKYKKRKEEALRKLEKTHDNMSRVSDIITEVENQLNPLKEERDKALVYKEVSENLKNIEIALLVTEITKLNGKYQENKLKIEEINQQIIEISTNNTSSEVKILEEKKQIDDLNTQIDSCQKQLIEIISKIEKLNSEKQILLERKKYEADNQVFNINLINLKEQELKINNNIAKIKQEISSKKNEIESLVETKKSLENTLKSLKGEKYTIETNLSKLLREREITQNKIKHLTDSIENNSLLPNSVTSILNNPKLKGIHDVLGNLIEVEKSYAECISVALGMASNNIIVDNEFCAKEAIEHLKKNQIGRATFFPLNIIKPRTVDEDTLNIIKNMNGFIDTADNLVKYQKTYYNIVKNQLGNVIVTVDLDSANLISSKINHRYKIVTLDGELLHIGGSITGGKSRQYNIINEKYELENNIELLNKIQLKINDLENKINDFDYNLKINEDKLYILNKDMINIETFIDNQNLILNNYNSELEIVVSEIKGLNNILNGTLSEEEEMIIKSYYEEVKKRDEINFKLLEFTKKRDLINYKIEEIEYNFKKQNSTFLEKNNQLKNLEIEVNRLDVKLDNLLNYLNETYNMTYEFALNNYKLEIEYNLAKEEVSKLKRKLKEIGYVNLNAPELYDNINERYEFLTKQKEDLINAENSLLNIIEELDEVMKKEFIETFDVIQSNFKVIFKELFKGGSAYLKLTEPNNILETGIDIIAQPPGKKLTSINLLSGGEKTFTAISLLFAILNSKTVPFCIFDEVEAALDEVNVEAFGNYLVKLKEKTQFILITHKKKTMEFVDLLYGITMQESGVSKLVSVKLEEIKN